MITFSKAYEFIQQFPLPFIAALGLLAGIIAQLILGMSTQAHVIWFATLLVCGVPLVLTTVWGVVRGQFSVDIIAALAIITAFIMNEAFTGAVLVLMQSGGQAMEKYGLKRAMFTLDALLSRAPKTAIRMQAGGQEIIPVGEVKVGDILLIRPGELVGVDGTVIDGEGEIDDAAITGEPFVRFVNKDKVLLSGSILVNGALTLRADKTTEKSQYATIVKLVQQAQQEKGSIQRLADRYAIIFTPLTLLIAAIGFAITQEAITILAVLVVATPCPLILATPVAVLSGVNRAAKAGIIVKGGAPLEKLAAVDVVVLDKTGTLTQGIPVIDNIVVFPGAAYSTDEVLYRAGIIEQQSSHAVAKATTKAAIEKFPQLPQPTQIRETPGAGVIGDYENKPIAVGTADYIQSQLTPEQVPAYLTFMQTFAHEEKLMSVIAMNGQCLGVIFFVDAPRPKAIEMISALRRMGIKHIVMLTGDNPRNAHRIAQALGITMYRAGLHPEDKVAVLKEISARHHHTLMVGDGINDAPALASAFVGMAMGAQGVAIAAQAADIVLLEDNIEGVVSALAIGRRMLYIAKQGIWIGMGLSLLLMCIAACGLIPPPVGVVLQEIIDVTVIFNALRARK